MYNKLLTINTTVDQPIPVILVYTHSIVCDFKMWFLNGLHSTAFKDTINLSQRLIVRAPCLWDIIILKFIFKIFKWGLGPMRKKVEKN